MKVIYHVAASDLAEDRAVAVLLGASTEDAMLIDSVMYKGASWAKAPKVRYVKVEFFAGDRLIATREIGRIDDPYNVKATRIYERARALCQKEQKDRAK